MRESHGFSHVWTFDTHILWEEPYVIYSQILAETRNVVVGPMVTNPATRDWTVTATVYATLNEMYGNRTVCGIGRDDSAVRVTNGAPTNLADACARRSTSSASSPTVAASTTRAPSCASRGRRGAELEVWGAAYGPKALALDRRGRPTGSSSSWPILVIAEWTIDAVRDAAEKAGRDPDDDHHSASPRRPTSTAARPMAPTGATSAAGSAAWSATTWPTSSSRYGTRQRRCRKALTDYIKGREGYDYNEHGQAGQHPHAIRARRDRRPLLHRSAPSTTHIERMLAS